MKAQTWLVVREDMEIRVKMTLTVQEVREMLAMFKQNDSKYRWPVSDLHTVLSDALRKVEQEFLSDVPQEPGPEARA